MGKTDNIYIKKARRKKKIKKSIFIICVLIAIMVGIIYKTNIFEIRNVKVTGDIVVSNEYMSEASENFKGDNLFFLSANDIKRKLQRNPYIKNVIVHKKFPSTLELEIFEATGLYYIYDGDDNNIVSNDCIILEKTEEIKNKNLIQLIGIDINGKNLGDLAIDDTRIKGLLAELYKEQQVIKENKEGFSITGIDISDMSSIKIYMGGIYILIGNDDNVRKKMSDAINIYKTGLVTEYINVSFEGTPDFK